MNKRINSFLVLLVSLMLTMPAFAQVSNKASTARMLNATKVSLNANKKAGKTAMNTSAKSKKAPATYNYKKVTATTDLANGEYLIVYEDDSKAFNGALPDLETTSNYIDVTINNGIIASSDIVDGATFTINMTAGTIKSASGLYIGNTNDVNKLECSPENQYTNTISVTDGVADIISSSNSRLRFNTNSAQLRFRYYKAASYASQQPIALYKKVSATESETSYTYSFTQSLNGWTTIDADGDGQAWHLSLINGYSGPDGSPGMMTSASYNAKALNPDNYLVSPKMKLDGKITFYASAQDAAYPAEHFGVAVSTAGNTSADDFQMVSDEWEMTAAAKTSLPANAPARSPRKVMGAWKKYEVDLSSFAGAEGYVAIRHFNCTDQFRLNVDDITLETSELLDPYDPDLELGPIELPEGAEATEYNMSYTDSNDATQNIPINVAVVGDKVYFQGMSTYLPEAWVVGTIADNVVTFNPNQFMGVYENYGASYFFYSGEIANSENTFTYDPEADTYTAIGEVIGVLNEEYYDGYYINPVLSHVQDVPAVPATPTITSIEQTEYGDVLVFNVPTTDGEGNGIITGKLSFQFFIDDESNPMVFTTDDYTKLEENMTVIPYGFTDNYDFSQGYLYLNMQHDTWTKIGIQSIYNGGGEENKSEIFWFNMPVPPVVAPDGLETAAYTFTAATATGGDESVTENYSLIVEVGFDGDDVYIQGLAQDNPDFWVKGTKNGEGQYVIPANQYMGKIEFWGFVFEYYWTGVDGESNMTDAVFNFDAETNTFTAAQPMALNASANTLDYNLLFEGITISKFEEKVAKPANPTFESFTIGEEAGYSTIYASIPTTDVDGNMLNTNKLFYIIWFEKDGEAQPYVFTADLYSQDFEEDVTEVPYKHDGYDIYAGGEIIYLEDELEELATWTNVGIQTVYYGGDERQQSDIVWIEDTTTGINQINAATDNAKARVYNLQGQKVSKPGRGIYIINGRKVLVK